MNAPTSSPRERGRFQYGLGALFTLATLLSIGLATWNSLFRPYWTQQAIVAKFQALHPPPEIVTEPAIPSWLRWIPGMNRLVKVKSLNLEHCPITDADLEPLPSLLHLERLYLASTAITDKALESIDSLSNLQRLSLWKTSVTDRGMRHIAKLGNLRLLDIQETGVTVVSLAELKTLPNLSVLRHSLTLKDADMQTIGEFPKLRRGCAEVLHLESVTSRGMRFIGRMQSVVWLYISNSQIDFDWGEFARLSALENLELSQVNMGSDGLRAITELRRLQRLRLLNVRIAGGWEHIQKMQSLRTLSVNTANWSREGVEALAGLPNLLYVHLEEMGLKIQDVAHAWGNCLTNVQIATSVLCGSRGGRRAVFVLSCKITDCDPQWLEDLSAAKRVTFGVDCGLLERVDAMPSIEEVVFAHELSDQVLRRIGKSRRLRTLVLSGNPYYTTGCEKCSPNAFQALAGITNLETLEFEGHKPRSDQLGVLKEMSQLRHLKIGDGSNFTDAGLSYLENLTRLESLEIRKGRRITDQGMTHLSRLTSLHKVILQDVDIGDVGLNCLARLPALESVELSGSSRISREAVAEFKRTHPQCRFSMH